MVDVFIETVLPGIASISRERLPSTKWPSETSASQTKWADDSSHMNSQLLGLHAQDLNTIKPSKIRAWLEEVLMKSFSAEGRGESVFLKDLIPERVSVHQRMALYP